MKIKSLIMCVALVMSRILVSTKTYTTTPDERTKRTERERKIHTVRPAGLKTWRGFSYTIITKNACF
jgi:hypothetical protein